MRLKHEFTEYCKDDYYKFASISKFECFLCFISCPRMILSNESAVLKRELFLTKLYLKNIKM